MITYTYPLPKEHPTFRVPKLHKVNYSPKYNWGEAHRWCQENCRAPFYLGPSWSGHFIEFEDDEDAVMFALRFA